MPGCFNILFYLFLMPLGYLGYRFEVMPSPEMCKKQLKVNNLFIIFGTFKFSLECDFICSYADELISLFGFTRFLLMLSMQNAAFA